MKKYKVYAFRVGNRFRESSYFHLFTDPGKQILISYYFWGIQTPEEFVLVDTGFPLGSVRKINADIIDFQPPEKLLNNIGIDPAQIKKVILTHLHWDHCSSIEMFKDAIFYLQKRDLQFFSGPLAKHPTLRQFIDTDMILKLLRLNYEGRVHILEGEDQIAPGIEVIPMGGHTPGSQVISVSAEGKDILIAGDVIPFYRNLTERIPTGLYWDLSEVLLAHERIEKMVKSPDSFIPGHDPLVASKFDSENGVVTIG
jgi:glyoxylase-like metal-dependent hydrolase (beta-lactamase superfamily II)